MRSNGEPYAPWRFKQLVKELYLISKSIHTSYTELLDITPTEKDYILQFMVEEVKKSEEELQKVKAEAEARAQAKRQTGAPKMK